MRICGGQYRGRKLNTPTSDHIRPTSDKVRQALFNMRESRNLVRDKIVLDGFCGTGALGLESLSRGATFCTFIDKDRRSIKTCSQNVEMLGINDQAHIIQSDTSKIKINPTPDKKADLIFLDPPYNMGLIDHAIQALEKGNWISDEAIYVVESEKSFTLSDVSDTSWTVVQEKIYKDTKIMILEKKETS